MLLAAVMGCRTLLWESSDSPTHCRELVGGWPDYIGVCDASSHDVGGVIFGKNEACVPTVFRWEWSQDTKNLYLAKKNHQLRPGDGWPAFLVASDGISL